MKAVAYIRVSTTMQAQEGESLDMQRAKAAAWAQLNDAELIAVFEDAGLSGMKYNREGLCKALELAKANKAALVVYSLSRLGRSTKDTLSVVDALNKAGCDLVSLSERIDTTSAGGKMVFRMMAAMAEFERDLISERTRDTMQNMKAQGRVVGQIRHGYQRAQHCDGVVVENKVEREVIDLAKQLRSHGMSLREISAELAKRGAFNRAGRQYNPKSVASLLTA